MTPRLRLRTLGLVGGAVFVLVGGAFAASAETNEAPPPPAGTIAASISIPTPGDIAFTSGRIWVAETGRHAVARIDPATNRATPLPVGDKDGTTGLATAKGALWVANQAQPALLELDPRQEKVVATIPTPNIDLPLAVGAGSLWWLTTDRFLHDRLIRFDLATKKLRTLSIRTGKVPLRGDLAGLVFAHGSLYGLAGNRVWRLDPARNAVVATYGPLPAANNHSLAVAGSSIWIALSDLSKIVRFDAVKNRIAASVNVAYPQTLAASDTELWVASRSSIVGGKLALVRVNARTTKDLGRLPLSFKQSAYDFPVTALAIRHDGSVWVGMHFDDRVLRIQPQG